MKQVDTIKRGTFDRTIPLSVRQDFKGALIVMVMGFALTLMPKSNVSFNENQRTTHLFT